MYHQRAKAIFWGTLIVFFLLALAWYFLMVRSGSSGSSGMLVEAEKGAKELFGCLKTCRRLSI